jgi:hypothetical protein
MPFGGIGFVVGDGGHGGRGASVGPEDMKMTDRHLMKKGVAETLGFVVYSDSRRRPRTSYNSCYIFLHCIIMSSFNSRLHQHGKKSLLLLLPYPKDVERNVSSPEYFSQYFAANIDDTHFRALKPATTLGLVVSLRHPFFSIPPSVTTDLDPDFLSDPLLDGCISVNSTSGNGPHAARIADEHTRANIQEFQPGRGVGWQTHYIRRRER